MRKHLRFLLPVTILAALLAGCGGGGGNKVRVELREWSVAPATTSAASGKISFEAVNAGTRNHELRVMRLGGAAPQPVGVIDSFPAGQTKSKEFNLSPGRYELSCQLVDPDGSNHYQLGMRIEFTVQ